MKMISSKWLIIAAAIFLLAGCGGGGGGSNENNGGNPSGGGDSSMTVNVVSLTTATTTNTFTGSFTTTPAFIGIVSHPSVTQAIVEMSGPDLQVSVCANMQAGPGTYAIDSGLMCTGVQYIVISAGTGTKIYGAESGTITVNSYGSVGEPITGSFDSIVTNLTDTQRVWGVFSIKRIM